MNVPFSTLTRWHLSRDFRRAEIGAADVVAVGDTIVVRWAANMAAQRYTITSIGRDFPCRENIDLPAVGRSKYVYLSAQQ